MLFPENSSSAAKMVKDSAKRSKLSLSAFCVSKGIHPSVVYNWQVRKGGYDKDLLSRLIDNAF